MARHKGEKGGPRHGSGSHGGQSGFVLGDASTSGMTLGATAAEGVSVGGSGGEPEVVYGREAAYSHMVVNHHLSPERARQALEQLAGDNPDAEFVLGQDGTPSVWGRAVNSARGRHARSRSMGMSPEAQEGLRNA